MIKKLGVCLLVMLLPLSLQAAEFKEGVHYIKLPQPVRTADPSRVEVVELFGYTCPHCNNFEPVLEHWQSQQPESVKFVRVPVVFSKTWEPYARAYYASELLKTLDKTHQATFDAIHIQRKRLSNQSVISSLYGDLGVDTAAFDKMYNSFAVSMKLKQGESKVRGYAITGVPSMVVNGKYRITVDTAGGQKEMLDVVNFLVEKESQIQK
ncbi:thiol:disulfide interchange protein DsbA/DsbL [Pontibacter sp. JAM-7]|uniref:thiol:disulfide interchange protein DsbA/DsbL n=1 Tax=Pontibacter sp. JAM-7 TaxID=3366581 RepID=UPI003AF63E06